MIMSSTSLCCGCEQQFNHKVAERDLRRYRKEGALRTSQLLVDALVAAGVEDFTLLDIGGGVGAVQHGLLQAGVAHVTSVDASSAYIAASKKEADRRGYTGRIAWYREDFVTAEVDAADIVTLDRVICCYRDVAALVGRSVDHACRLDGVVYPRYTWWTRSFVHVANMANSLRRSEFRAYIHSSAEVERIVENAGFVRRFYAQTLIWQIIVYGRDAIV